MARLVEITGDAYGRLSCTPIANLTIQNNGAQNFTLRCLGRIDRTNQIAFMVSLVGSLTAATERDNNIIELDSQTDNTSIGKYFTYDLCVDPDRTMWTLTVQVNNGSGGGTTNIVFAKSRVREDELTSA